MTNSRMIEVSWLMIGLLLAGSGCTTAVASGSGPDCIGDACDEPCVGEACEALTHEEHEEMLAELGVDLDPDPPTDPEGTPLPEDHNPLGQKNTSLFELNELFFAGMTLGEGADATRVGLLEDAEAGSAPLFTGDDDDLWAGHAKQAVAIDLDGDGLEEIAVIALLEAPETGDTTLVARTLRREGDGFAMSAPQTVLTFTTEPLSWEGFWSGYFQLDAVAADLEGDGTDDLFVSVGRHLLQLRPEGAGFVVVDERTFDDPGGDELAEVYVRLAAGDLELDGRDELVIATSAFYTAYRSPARFTIVKDDLRTEVTSGLVQETTHPRRELATASPVIADLDGDDVPEVAFAGRSTLFVDGLVVLVMNGSKGPAPYAFRDTKWEDTTQRAALYPAAAADLYGSGRSQLLVGGTILRLARDTGELEPLPGAERLPVIPNTDVAVTGDYTGDHRDDILFIRGAGSGVYLSDYDVQGFSIVHVDSTDRVRVDDTTGSAGIGDYPTFAFANVDDDSPVMQFVGRELMFGDPSIIAVVAAPPAFAAGEQADGSTSFGQSESEEVSEEASLGFSVGIGFGFEAEDPTGFYGGGFEASVEASMGWTTSHTRSIERTVSFATGPQEDKVVFTAVPYDVYVYEVVSSPNPEAVGTRVGLAVPREPQVLNVARDFFNERVRGQVAAIDERVLSHEVGEPFSYPTRADRDARIAAGDALYSDFATVGVGAGSTTVTVSRSEGVGHGTSAGFAASLEISAKVNGVTARLTTGMSMEVSETVTNTEGTFYEGTVGDIPVDRIDELGLYQFGLLSYPQLHGGREMLVVTYWVEE